MPDAQMSRNSQYDVVRQVVGIVSVNLDSDPPRARGLVRGTNHEIPIDIRFAVGEIDVTPAISEQWYVVRRDNIWRLDSRIPFQYPARSIERVQGQSIIGSGHGPVELAGTVVTAHGPLRLFTCTTADRPNPDDLDGSMIFDTTLGKPIWAFGGNWVDATGAVV
jgi:hypothetical protein